MMIPTLFERLCDDAALFPPGNAALSDAIPTHVAHKRSRHAAMVGPFVFPAQQLDRLSANVRNLEHPIELILTVSSGTEAVLPALTQLRALDNIELASMEIAMAPGQSSTDLFVALNQISSEATDINTVVEVPRDARRVQVLAEMAGTHYAAKFRTGGVEESAYPSETELAEAIWAAVNYGVRFKLTAGLHHAVRNTDPHSQFEQHGFLNVMVATYQARHGASTEVIAETLAERDGPRLAADLNGLSAEAARELRASFLSFGTCSITDPMTELDGLGLLARGSSAAGCSRAPSGSGGSREGGCPA